MKRFYLLLTILFFSCVSSFAQNAMSDQQIIDYVVSEQAKGTSQSEIVTYLMKRGVKIDQIRSIQRKLKLEDGGALNAKDLMSNGLDSKYDRSRTRKQNGETRKDNTLKNSAMGRIKPDRSEERGVVHTYDEFDPEFMEMRGVLDEMYPDSIELLIQERMEKSKKKISLMQKGRIVLVK